MIIKIFLTLILAIFCEFVYAQNESVIFMDKQITFGMTLTEFLSNNVGYNLNTDDNKYDEIKVLRMNEEDDGAWFLVFVKFYKDELFELKIDELYSTESEKKDLKNLIKQFKIVKEENNKDGKKYNQYLEKETIVGIYEVDDFGSIFTCSEIELLRKVQTRYPDYGK